MGFVIWDIPPLRSPTAPGARASDMPSCYTHPRARVPVVPTLPAPPTIDQTTEEPGSEQQLERTGKK